MQDRFTVRLVVAYLGAIVLTTIIAGVLLRLRGIDVPGELWGLGGTALGSLGTMLATTHSSPPNPPTVEVSVPLAGPQSLRPGQQAVNQPKGA